MMFSKIVIVVCKQTTKNVGNINFKGETEEK